jgi:hypothetical protein
VFSRREMTGSLSHEKIGKVAVVKKAGFTEVKVG